MPRFPERKCKNFGLVCQGVIVVRGWWTSDRCSGCSKKEFKGFQFGVGSPPMRIA